MAESSFNPIPAQRLFSREMKLELSSAGQSGYPQG
jgi:hypothetical protein